MTLHLSFWTHAWALRLLLVIHGRISRSGVIFPEWENHMATDEAEPSNCIHKKKLRVLILTLHCTDSYNAPLNHTLSRSIRCIPCNIMNSISQWSAIHTFCFSSKFPWAQISVGTCFPTAMPNHPMRGVKAPQLSIARSRGGRVPAVIDAFTCFVWWLSIKVSVSSTISSWSSCW